MAIEDPSLAVSFMPSSGTRVRRGSVVTLKVGCPHCGVASIAVPNKQPTYRVPNFVGRSANAAYAWVRHMERLGNRVG